MIRHENLCQFGVTTSSTVHSLKVAHLDEIRPEDQPRAGGPAGLDHSLYANIAELEPLSPGAAPDGRTTTIYKEDPQYSSVHFNKLRNSSVQLSENPLYSEVKPTESSSRNEHIYSLVQMPPGN